MYVKGVLLCYHVDQCIPVPFAAGCDYICGLSYRGLFLD